MIRGKLEITHTPSPRRAFRTCGCRRQRRCGDYAKQSQSCPVSHGRAGRNREIRSTRLETRNKPEKQMIQTDQSAPNEANFGRFGAGMRVATENKANSDVQDCRVASLLAMTPPGRGPGMTNEPNFGLFGRKTRVGREYKANLWAGGPALGIGDCRLGIRGGGGRECRGVECQTNPICWVLRLKMRIGEKAKPIFVTGDARQCISHRQADACRCHPGAGQGRGVPVAGSREPGMSNEPNFGRFGPGARVACENKANLAGAVSLREVGEICGAGRILPGVWRCGMVPSHGTPHKNASLKREKRS